MKPPRNPALESKPDQLPTKAEKPPAFQEKKEKIIKPDKKKQQVKRPQKKPPARPAAKSTVQSTPNPVSAASKPKPDPLQIKPEKKGCQNELSVG
ncbi:MAG: hypothetical protein D3910_05380, partial [Candidatus Electrothrix sp. ATG2]|nr:hypothetical protein [Candidatus Electrothrix sp. ATG2]